MRIKVIAIIILLLVGSIVTTQNLQRSETPKIVAERFFYGYIECLNLVYYPNGPYKDEKEPAWVICTKDKEYLTDQLKDTILKSKSKFKSDPLLCAQDVPTSVTYKNEIINGDRAIVDMISKYGEPGAKVTGTQKTTVNLFKLNGYWKIWFVERTIEPGSAFICSQPS